MLFYDFFFLKENRRNEKKTHHRSQHQSSIGDKTHDTNQIKNRVFVGKIMRGGFTYGGSK